MSGAITIGGVSLATIGSVAGGIGALASAGLAISNAVGGQGAPSSGGAAASDVAQLSDKASQNASLRSSLLATSGQSAGSPLQPGSVGGTGTLFGN